MLDHVGGDLVRSGAGLFHGMKCVQDFEAVRRVAKGLAHGKLRSTVSNAISDFARFSSHGCDKVDRHVK
eukprot:4699768-Heterocapsa_arctica.AAC.1